MDARTFNSLFSSINEEWAGKVLNMRLNRGYGPDLIDDKKVVEVKFTLIDTAGKYPLSWTILEHQMKYNNRKPLFWALGTYRLNAEVIDIEETDFSRIEKERKLYIVEYGWMLQFPPSRTIGKTKRTKWDNILRYPKLSNLPQIKKTYEVEGGLVHLTEGVPARYFKIMTKEIPF